MKIKIPEGLTLDVGPGEKTDLLTKVKVSEDGTMIELISIDDVLIPTEEGEAVEEGAIEGDISDEDINALLSGLGGSEEEVPAQDDYMAQRKTQR